MSSEDERDAAGSEPIEQAAAGGPASEAPPEKGTGEDNERAEPSAEEPVTLTFAQYEELRTLAAERDDYLNRLRRSVADYQNLQNRITKIRAAANHDALRGMALQVVPLADSLARALDAAAQHEGAENIGEGLRMIEKEFYTILGNLDIAPIEAVGKPFDPHYHEAAFQEPVQGTEPNTVVRELKKGFVMGDEVIRPAQVAVAARAADSQQ